MLSNMNIRRYSQSQRIRILSFMFQQRVFSMNFSYQLLLEKISHSLILLVLTLTFTHRRIYFDNIRQYNYQSLSIV